MAHALTVLPASHSSIVAAVEDGGSYSSSRRLSSAVSDKVFDALQKLRRAIQNKRRGMLSAGIVFLHDNARKHTAQRTASHLQLMQLATHIIAEGRTAVGAHNLPRGILLHD
jgi:hypothetical protein